MEMYANVLGLFLCAGFCMDQYKYKTGGGKKMKKCAAAALCLGLLLAMPLSAANAEIHREHGIEFEDSEDDANARRIISKIQLEENLEIDFRKHNIWIIGGSEHGCYTIKVRQNSKKEALFGAVLDLQYDQGVLHIPKYKELETHVGGKIPYMHTGLFIPGWAGPVEKTILNTKHIQLTLTFGNGKKKTYTLDDKDVAEWQEIVKQEDFA